MVDGNTKKNGLDEILDAILKIPAGDVQIIENGHISENISYYINKNKLNVILRPKDVTPGLSMGAVHFSKGTKKENKGYGYSPIDFIQPIYIVVFSILFADPRYTLVISFLDPVNIFKKIIFDTYLKCINIVLRDVYQKKFFNAG